MTDSTRPPTDDVTVTDSDAGVVIEVTVAAPVTTVWPHLRDPELIRRWHGWDDPGLDEEIDLIYARGVQEDESTYELRLAGGPAPGSVELGDRFDLRPSDADPAATVVRITRGPRGGDDDWDAMYDDITQGWIAFLAQLRYAVERQPGRTRRTVFCGTFAGPTIPAVSALGLDHLRTGEPYALTPGPGLDLSGTVWFRTEHQIGLTVERYGPGLVVVGDKPGNDPATSESAMVIVSTFGLSDDDFARLETSWQGWWSEHVPAAAETPPPDPSA